MTRSHVAVLGSQKEILKRLANYEASVAYLYIVFAQKFPQAQDHWRDLAQEELSHVNLLLGLNRLLDSGQTIYNIERVSLESIEASQARVDYCLLAAETDKLTEMQAISAALSIESCITDANFYEIVTSDAPEYRDVAGRLASETHDHVKRMRDFRSSRLAAEAEAYQACA